MTNLKERIIIHINRKYHISLASIFKVKQKKSGRVWVYYLDRNSQVKIAVAANDGRTLLSTINQYLVILGEKQMFLEIE